ncbi:MAG: D-alanyl-D-alanine carboxypeptidase [Clostridia bacterium]|nr:D-alanyl-D-alanine carboxypeptidase [Clostridia bacterium]
MQKSKIIKLSITIIFSILTIALLILNSNHLVSHASYEHTINAGSSVLIERTSGKVLADQNSHARLPIASVTKLMTILIALEEIDNGHISLSDQVTVSSNASGMGGSQIFLDANQKYELSELLKSVIIASANDSSVAIAEYISGSENNFVKLMNEKAISLGMHDTNYVNCTGLPSIDGYSSAYDQAILLNNVLNYPTYREYSSIWLEDFVHPSGRITQMTNTNKLSRFYDGCIGGKTGSTNQAKYCLAVGAKRADMELISVVLGADNSKDRFKLASDMLNYGFDNFTTTTIFSNNNLINKTIEIKGQNRSTTLIAERNYSIVNEKNTTPNFSLNYNLPTSLRKVTKGDIVGNVEIVIDGIVVDTINILSAESHKESSIWDNFKEIVKN